MSSTADKLVERYLKHLDVELNELPRARRREIVDEISGHIVAARADLQAETEADVRNVLENLGDPAEIAAEARERFGVQPRTSGWSEIAAVILLLIGGLVLPVVGWFVGLVLLWASNAWNTRDKLIGTLVVPGGLALPLFLAFSVGGGSSGGKTCEIDPGTGQELNCTQFGTDSSADIIGIAVLAVLLLAPIVTTAYLAYRMRSHPAAATA